MDSGLDALHRPGMTASFLARHRILAQQNRLRVIANNIAQGGRRKRRMHSRTRWCPGSDIRTVLRRALFTNVRTKGTPANIEFWCGLDLTFA
jgi:hypothetical protein